MARQTSILWAIIFACIAVTFASVASAENEPSTTSPLATHLLVVYNSRDASSKELAEYYAEMRQISPERVLGIPCSEKEEITRDEYEREIRKPIEDYLILKKWLTRLPTKIQTDRGVLKVSQSIDNQIWAMALIRGIPLKISEDPTRPISNQITSENLRTNKASVDSELALLPFEGLPIEGYVSNVFFASQGERFFSQPMSDYMILVTRLDAPTAQQVRDMIRDTVETEKLRLTGRAVFDARGIQNTADKYFIGDDWIRTAAASIRADGFETILDENSQIIPAETPINDVAFYAGWYESDMKGLFTRRDFRFRKGAIAYHIHSFSASTMRSESATWAGPLISRGAVATMGAVYEPYLQFTPNVNSFTRSLLKGCTFAEAAYQSQNALSWMITFIGDPLYRPFPRTVDASIELAATEKLPQLDWLLLQRARQFQYASGSMVAVREMSERAVKEMPSAVSWEGFADLSPASGLTPEEVLDALTKARALAASPTDKVRIGLRIVEIYRSKKMPDKVMQTYESILAECPVESVFYKIPDRVAQYAAEAGLGRITNTLNSQPR